MAESEAAPGVEALRDRLARLVPEPDAALRLEEVTERAKAMLAAAGVDPEVFEEALTTRTVRYYRSKEIVSPPIGESRNARYGGRHVVEAATARLAGHLHHLSLAEAAERIGGLDDDQLVDLLTELVRLERRDRLARPLPGALERSAPQAEAPGVEASHAVVVRLPDGATLLLGADHPLIRSGMRGEEVGAVVAKALRAARAADGEER